MKTITDLKKEIFEIADVLQTQELKLAQQTRLKKKILLLQHCVKVLEFMPSETYLQSQIDDLENKISRRMLLFQVDSFDHLPKPEVAKLRKAHEALHEVPKLRKQLSALRSLL